MDKNYVSTFVIILQIMLFFVVNMKIVCYAFVPPLIPSLYSTSTSQSHDIFDKVLNMECYKECGNECLEKYLCGPRNILVHCLDVCEVICSNEDPKLPPLPPHELLDKKTKNNFLGNNE